MTPVDAFPYVPLDVLRAHVFPHCSIDVRLSFGVGPGRLPLVEFENVGQCVQRKLAATHTDWIGWVQVAVEMPSDGLRRKFIRAQICSEVVEWWQEEWPPEDDPSYGDALAIEITSCFMFTTAV
jgi:hypothetical protein